MNQHILFMLAVTNVLTDLSAAEISFNQDVRPILSEKCFHCHGIDAKNRKGKLRLDTPTAALGKGKSGALAIVPGKPEQSELWMRMTAADHDDRMPPAKVKKPLLPDEIEILQRWITEGWA